MTIPAWSLKQKQSLPLSAKIRLSEVRIRQWYDQNHGDVYIAFSGGYDSTVLLHLVRSLYKDVPAVFVDTGLEFPEIREFVKTIDNVTWIKPKIPFTQVVERYGYPVISKKVSMGVSRYRNTKSEVQRQLRLHGGTNPTSGRKQERTIPIKYHHIVDAPFKISERCCDVMKKQPFKKYNKETGLVPFTGEMAADSEDRRKQYLRTGCNVFSKTLPKSMPLALWLKRDVVEYTEKFNLDQCSVYDMGYDRTGCVFCMFGCQQEPEPGRFVLLRKTHPKLHSYCLEQLGMRKVLDYLEIPY